MICRWNMEFGLQGEAEAQTLDHPGERERYPHFSRDGGDEKAIGVMRPQQLTTFCVPSEVRVVSQDRK